MEATWFLALLSLSLVLLTFNLLARGKQKKLPPTPSRALPLIGHLHLLKPPTHRTFQKFSQKLGPVFSLRFGSRFLVVVSSPAAVEECFTTNDIVLADRARSISGKYIGYDHTILAASPYGEHWRNLRRLATVEIFSTSRLNMFQSIRQDEIMRLMQKLYQTSQHGFAQVKLRPLFSEMTFNVIMRMVTGKRYFGETEDTAEAKKFRDLIRETFHYSGISNPAEFLPFLRWIDYKDHEKNLARVSKEMDAFLQGLIDEKRHRDGEERVENTMIDHLLCLQKSQPEYYTDKIIKGIIIMMLLGGTDTSSVTIEWAMSALLNHPEKLQKARDEVDTFVGNNHLIDESQVSKLPYLQNIISETFRLFPATPMLVPHVSSQDCKVAGFDIPRGTILIVNAWAIHRDPLLWDDPTSFMPERFEGKEVGPATLLPFGMGRRSCPGKGLATRVVGLGLGSLIQGFEWKRMAEEQIDLSEGKGISMPKAVPLEAMCKARDVLRKTLSVYT